MGSQESPPWTFSSLPEESQAQPQTSSEGGDTVAHGSDDADGNGEEDQEVHYMYHFAWNPLMFILLG